MELNIKNYLEGIATEDEQRSLLNWLRDKKNRALFNNIKNEWSHSTDNASFPGGGDESWNRLQGKLWQRSYRRWKVSERMQQVFRYVAILLFFLTIGSLIYIITNRPVEMPLLTNKVIADKGQVSQVELPDGSTLWLNSGSEITYNNRFALKNREITLVGEAYFKVSENKELPFTVTCNDIRVQALGTQFNVSGYHGSGFIEIVLEDGSVELRYQKIKNFRHVLEPGKMARFSTSDDKFNVTDVNTPKYTSWKEGIIHIYDLPFEEVLKRLELRYNQKFTFEDKVKDFRYTFTIKNETLGEIIRLMEKITPVKAVQHQDVIIFKLDKRKPDIP